MDEVDRLRVGSGQRFGRAGKIVRRAGNTFARLRHGLQAGYTYVASCCRKRERSLRLNETTHNVEAGQAEGSERPSKKQRLQVDIQARAAAITPVIQPASGPSPLAASVAAPAAASVALPSAAFRADSVFTVGRSSPSQHRWGPDYSARRPAHLSYKRSRCLQSRMHGYSMPRPVIAAAAAGTPVASELPWQQRYYQVTRAQEVRRAMSAGKLDAHGRTLTQRLEIIVAKQAAAALARRNLVRFCTANASHRLPGSDIGLNSGPNIGPEPISTAETCVGGRSSERGPAGSAVMLSQASGEGKAQWGAPSAEHANGARSRQELRPQVLKPAGVVVPAPPMDLGVSGWHDEAFCEQALYSHPNPAASSEQLVQGSKPSSIMGTASVPGDVLLGCHTGLHQQVDAAVGPAAEAMGSPPLRPFRRAGFAAGSAPRVPKPAGMVMHPTIMDVGLMDAQVLRHNEAVHAGALCSPRHMDNTAASSEQLVQGSKPSSLMGTASVVEDVLLGSGTGRHQQVDAAVGPAAEAMGSPPLRPFRRAGFAAGSMPRVPKPAGMVMHPTTKDVGLMDAQVLRRDEAVHEGALCSPSHMHNIAGALAAEQSYPTPPPGAFASPQPIPLPTTQPGASPVLLAALEQEPSVDTLQPKDRAAESRVKAAAAVALQKIPAAAIPLPPLRPYRRAGFAADSTPRVPKPAGVVMHPTTMDVGLMDAQLLRHDEAVHAGALCSPHHMGNTAGALAAEQSYPPPPPDASSQPTPLPTTQPGASPVLLAALEQESSVDTLQPKDRSAESQAKAAGAVVLQTTSAGPAALAMHPIPLHPFPREWTGAGAAQRVLQPAGVVMHAPTKDVGLADQHWDGVEAMSEQQARADSLQSRGKAAQPEAADAVAPPPHPAVQASGSFGDAHGSGNGDVVSSSGGDDVMGGCSSGRSVDGSFGDADSASSMGNGSRPGSSGGSSHGCRSSIGGSSDDEGAAADSGLAPVASAQRRVEGEEQGRQADSNAEMSRRVTAKEEASRFLTDVGYLHDGRRPMNPVCDDPVADVDMEENEDADSELEDYCDTTSISSWAPTSPLPAPQATWPPLPTQPAALGMPPIPPPLQPAGFPAAAESGSAPQPWKCPPWGSQKRKRQESSEEGKRHSVLGGAGSTTQQGSAWTPTQRWPPGGAASTAPQGRSPALPPGWGGPWSPGSVGLANAANAMQGLPPLGTHAAAAQVAGGEAKQVAGPAAAGPAALANPCAQRTEKGEEQGRGPGSEAEISWRVTAKEEASRFLAEIASTFMEAPGAESAEGSQGVGGMLMGASPSEALLQAGTNLHEGRRQVNLECDDPVADADMRQDDYAEYELEEYVDTTPISSWAPTSALPAPATTGLPLPTQPAALRMPPISPPPMPAGWEHGKVAEGAGSSMQRGSAWAQIQSWPPGGAASTAPQGSALAPPPGWGGPLRAANVGLANAANAMQGITAVGTDAATARVAGGEAKQVAGPAGAAPAAFTNPSANEGKLASSSFGSSQVQSAVRNSPTGIQSSYQFSSFF